MIIWSFSLVIFGPGERNTMKRCFVLKVWWKRKNTGGMIANSIFGKRDKPLFAIP